MTNEPESSAMRGVNRYWRELSEDDIARGQHRAEIGSMWEEVGLLQFQYVRGRGLAPAHRLLDVGCGPLRGGVHFIRYLEPGHYYGIDINRSLLLGGEAELHAARLADRAPHLAVTGGFDARGFGVTFDHVIAISLFTHLFANQIARCLTRVAEVMTPASQLHATFFEAPDPVHLDDIEHLRGIVSHYDADPFHYSVQEMELLARSAGLTTTAVGDWGHPRGQRMLRFELAT